MQLIFDIGAHRGEDTDFYLKKGFKVIAVEANPSLAQDLRDKFAEAIRNGQLVVVEAAIAAEDGTVDFFVNRRPDLSTIVPSWAERNLKLGAASTKVTVTAVSFATLLKRYGIPHYLKIDIEGADMFCVHALETIHTRPKFVSVESNKTSWRALVSEFDVLERLGYTRFKLVNQATIDTQREPVPVLEGRVTNHQFRFGSTGLFGADLPGTWLTKRQALRAYRMIFIKYKLFGDNTRGERIARMFPAFINRLLLPAWYDTHAALP